MGKPVEFLKAHEDGSWSTEVIEVPSGVGASHPIGSPTWDAEVTEWAHNLAALQYRKIVLWAIYNPDPQTDEVTND